MFVCALMSVPIGRRLVRRVARVRAVGGVVVVDRGEVAERDVGVVDAAVEDGDRHAGAIEARIGVDGGRTDVRDGLLEVIRVVDDRRDRDDRRVRRELGELRSVDLEDDGVDGDLGSSDHGAIGRADEPILLGRHLAERLALGRGGRARGRDLADRFLAQLDDDLADAASGKQRRVQGRWPGRVDGDTRIGDPSALQGLGHRSLTGELGVGRERGRDPEHGQQEYEN